MSYIRRSIKRYAELGALITIVTVVIWIIADTIASESPGTSAETEAKSYVSLSSDAVVMLIVLLFVSVMAIALIYSIYMLVRRRYV